jgi:FixJ family two-component response regulator
VAAYNSAAAFLNGGLDQAACLIVDHHMPDMTGLELVTHLREASSSIPALLVTASPSATLIDRAHELGIRVLEKPVGADEFFEFIEGHHSK